MISVHLQPSGARCRQAPRDRADLRQANMDELSGRELHAERVELKWEYASDWDTSFGSGDRCNHRAEPVAPATTGSRR